MSKRFIVLVVLMASVTAAACAADYYLPHVAYGGGMGYTFIFFNVNDHAATASFTLTGDSGSPMAVTIPGRGTNSAFDLGSLQPGQTMILKTDGGAGSPLTTGACTVTCSDAMGVSGIFSLYDGVGNLLTEAGVGKSEPKSDMYVPVDATGTFWTGFAIFNPSATQAANVTVSLYQTSGAMAANPATFPLAAQNHLSKFFTGPGQLFPDIANFRGLAEIRSDIPLAGLAIRLNTQPSCMTTVPAVAGDSADTALYLSHLATGAFPGGTFKTTFLIFDISDQPANGTLTLTQTGGAPLPVTITGAGSNLSVFPFDNLPSKGSLFWETDGSGPLATGGAAAQSLGGAPLGVASIFTMCDSQGRFSTEAGVLSSEPMTQFTLPVDMTGGYDTGFALFNPGTTSSTVTARFFDAGGSLQATAAPITLVAKDHVSQYASELFPAVGKVQGSISFVCSTPVSAVTLRFNPSPLTLTTLPVQAGAYTGTAIVSVTNVEGGSTFTAGEEVVVGGRGFGAARASKDGGQSYVSFMPQSSGRSPVNALSYALWSDTTIRCTIPGANVAGTYLVQANVVDPSGTTAVESPSTISIASATPPTITSLTPLTVNQGGTINLYGDAFGAEVDDFYESVQNGGYIQFGAKPNIIQQDIASYWTRTMVICQVPASVPTGSTPVTIVTGGGLTSNAYYTNVVGPTEATIGAIAPSPIDVGATTPITIAGTNFGNTQGTGSVTFQAVDKSPVVVVSVTSWADAKIVCPTPSGMTTAEGAVSVTVLAGSGKTSNSYAFLVDDVGPLLHGPRLGLITQTTADVSWDTRDSEVGRVEWGRSSTYSDSMMETSATTAHRLTIAGLSPATTYHYAVVAGGKIMADHAFTTAPPDGTGTFVFASLADNRGHTDQADLQSITVPFLNILNHMAELKPAFAIHAGDIFYGNTQTAIVKPLYDTFKIGTDPFCADISMLFSPGNHEMQPQVDPQGQPASPLELYNQEFYQPAQLPGYEGTTYSFDWGNSHFVSVDSCHTDVTRPYSGMAYIGDPVIAWLEGDLRAAQARKVRHIFVFSHTNAFSKWSLYYLGLVDQAQRDKFWAVLAKYNVDVYICGHDHLFNDQLGTEGVVQWLNGNSGSVVPGNGPNQFTIWTVNGDTVEADLLNDAGQSTYKRTIQSSQPK